MLRIDTPLGKADVRFFRYAGTDNTGIELRSSFDEQPTAHEIVYAGELLWRATVNLAGEFLPFECVAIKDYGENTGMVGMLQDGGIIGNELVRVFRSGFVMIPVYRLRRDALVEAEAQIYREEDQR